MLIENNFPKISNQIYENDVHKVMENNFNQIANFWVVHQADWISGVYDVFKDHDKFLIIIYLLKRTFDFYSRNFVKLSIDQFFLKKRLEIEKFNVIEVSQNLNMPKETARRKIIELENEGVIKRINKKIIIDKSVFPRFRPDKASVKTAYFLNKFSRMLKKHKVLDKEISAEIIKKNIQNNFTYTWKLFYELQLPIVNRWKVYFKDIVTWNIWGTCAISKTYNSEMKNTTRITSEYIDELLTNKSTGLNAMTISDLTKIPRATVVRKLKNLVSSKHLVIDKKKCYHPSSVHIKDINNIQKENSKVLATFATKIFNIILHSENKIDFPFKDKSS